MKADALRTLNTQLLAGNGPDLFVLDGLPINTYINNGILLDLKDILKPYQDKKLLADNIIDTYKIEDSYYAIPCRIHLLLLYGSKEDVTALQSLKSLYDYLQTNKKKTIFTTIKPNVLNYGLLRLYLGELFTEKNELNEDAINMYLDVLDELIQRQDLIDHDYMVYDVYSKIMPGMIDYTDDLLYFTGSYQGGKLDSDQLDVARIAQVKNPNYLSIVALAEKKGGMYWENYKNSFIPKTVVGISAGSKHQEEASQFLQTLLSDDMQQVSCYYDGLTIYDAEYDGAKIFDKVNEFKSADNPTLEVCNKFVQSVHEINQRLDFDQDMYDQISPLIEDYLDGTMKKEELIQNLMNQANLYLKEQ